MTDKIDGPLKWHGGKSYLASKFVALMPPRCKTPNAPKPDDPGWLHYVEPYFGGGAVLLANDPEGISEVVNDLNRDLIGFWRTLAGEHSFGLFKRSVDATPFSESLWTVTASILTNPETGRTDRAIAFFLRCRQSLAGRMKGFTGITRQRTRRGMNAEVSAWLNCIEGLPAVHARLKRVLIRNKPAVDVIKAEDGPRTLYYCDPPYLFSTRATTGEYLHEMTEADHRELLETLASIKGRFMLSGYESPLYTSFENAHHWNCHRFDLPNNSAGGATKERRIECLWTNY